MKIGIIGSGPAGAMAAVRLARAGASVTLLDPSHPREKPCGGGLTGRALALIRDVIDIPSLPAITVTSAAFEQLERTARVPLVDAGRAPDSSLLIVSRAALDRALTNSAIAAGACFVPERAIDLSQFGRRWAVRTARATYQFDQVLGADGVNSVVRKRLARPFRRTQLSIAAGFFVHAHSSSTIVIKPTSEQAGYLWSFPRPDHLAVGICAPAAHHATSADLREQAGAWIRRHHLDRNARLIPYAWPIPSIGHDRRRDVKLGGQGWMLLGDAAGLVDPLTREGIYYALLSGEWAADALIERAGSRAAEHYSERMIAEIHPELARAARLCALFFTPVFSSLLVRALDESAAIRNVFVDLVGGAQTYGGLGRRLLATGHVALAARVIRMLLRPPFTGTMAGITSSHEIQPGVAHDSDRFA